MAESDRPLASMPRPPEMPASERVFIAPGESAFTRMPLGPRSRAA